MPAEIVPKMTSNVCLVFQNFFGPNFSESRASSLSGTDSNSEIVSGARRIEGRTYVHSMSCSERRRKRDRCDAATNGDCFPPFPLAFWNQLGIILLTIIVSSLLHCCYYYYYHKNNFYNVVSSYRTLRRRRQTSGQ